MNNFFIEKDPNFLDLIGFKGGGERYFGDRSYDNYLLSDHLFKFTEKPAIFKLPNKTVEDATIFKLLENSDGLDETPTIGGECTNSENDYSTSELSKD